MANKIVGNLSGGMNLSTSPLILKDTECELIVNYHLDQLGSLTRRKGYDVFLTQPVAAKQIVGLYQYTNTATPAETTQVMVANSAADANTVIYYNNGITWTLSKADTAITTFTNFNRYRFATFLDYLFRVNGTAVVGSSINVNGATWGTTNCPATITPSFIAVFTDRVYVARNGVAAGSRVYYSSLPAVPAAITWDITNDWFDVNPDDGDEITALENNGSRLLIFKNRALYRWQWGMVEPDRIIGVGTESQECVKTNFEIGITFFANSKGIYYYDGNAVKCISRKIQPVIDSVPAANWNDAVGEIDADHYYLYLGDSLTWGGTTYTNVMAVYTISLNALTIYCLNTPWRFANKLILSGAEQIYFGSSNGRTYLWNSGNSDDSGGANSDTAVNISTEVITKEFLLGFPDKVKLSYMDFISENCLTTSTFYQIDRKGDFKALCPLQERFSFSQHIDDSCYSVRLRLTDNSSILSRFDGLNIRSDKEGEQQ